jgi:hypothetical protein
MDTDGQSIMAENRMQDSCRDGYELVDGVKHVTLEVGANLWMMVACAVLSSLSFLVSVVTLLVIALRT